jgi:hypothetical protein
LNRVAEPVQSEAPRPEASAAAGTDAAASGAPAKGAGASNTDAGRPVRARRHDPRPALTKGE